jgi:hypothetical protein
MSDTMPNGESREAYMARMRKAQRDNLEWSKRESAKRNQYATAYIRSVITRMENAK